MRVATVGFHAFRATKTQRRNPIVATDLSIALVNAEMIFLKIVGAMFLAIAGRKILTPGV